MKLSQINLAKPVIAITIITAATIGTAQADTLYGLYADANYWQTDVTSSLDNNANNNAIEYDEQAQTMVSASLEHFIPVLPNVRLRHTTLNAETAKNKAANNINTAELALSNTDAIAYYEVLDNLVSLDLGVGAKIIEGDISQANNKTDLNKTLPMGYASVGAKLPFTGLSAKAELGVAKGSDANATDAQAEIKYKFIDNLAFDLGAKLGYRMLEVNYDDVNKKPLNNEFKGPYAGVELHF